MSQKIQDYKPLPQGLTVKKSNLHGLGLFATKSIPADYDLGVSHINDDRFPDGLIRTPMGGFINYSRQPNCAFIEIEDGWNLKTLRRIEAGEELTADYITYDEAVIATFK